MGKQDKSPSTGCLWCLTQAWNWDLLINHRNSTGHGIANRLTDPTCAIRLLHQTADERYSP
jgi:hypothetical protein